MADTIVLARRVYEAVLDMTQLPESQLIMMLENPDPTIRMASLWKALMDNYSSRVVRMIYTSPIQKGHHGTPG